MMNWALVSQQIEFFFIVEAQNRKEKKKTVKIVVSCGEACSDARGKRLFVPSVSK